MDSAHGKIWWSELMTRDPGGAQRFYAALTGWTFSTMPADGREYHVASRDGQPVAGIMDMADLPGMEGIPPHWFTYIAVGDVDAAVRLTRESGGKVMRDVFEVPDVGRIAIIADPTGAGLGIMTPIQRG
jgi:uncharacterized protein